MGKQRGTDSGSILKLFWFMQIVEKTKKLRSLIYLIARDQDGLLKTS